jgi:hypothetical protein
MSVEKCRHTNLFSALSTSLCIGACFIDWRNTCIKNAFGAQGNGLGEVEWIRLAQDVDHWQALEYTVLNLWVP